ncbi:ABC transporter ATP-binding protein [Kineococcus sp. SYSU DK003]|uniref:ABC transporter ATP-binding protein n=1 Tax=Kineococcus sp. SYSU DK003 TaxID=3383124 RepID=UPI003D7DEF15
MSPDPEPLLCVEDLDVGYVGARGMTSVLRGVSFTVARGQTLALVGESGSGKSTTAMAVAGLLPPTAQVSGRVRLDGLDLLGRSERQLTDVRGKQVAVVFQNPMTCLNPTMRIGTQICEQLVRHGVRSRGSAKARALELLDDVRIRDPRRVYRSYPHALSGGMRQRVMIAMAVSCEPRLLIADEPTTALDVTVQAEVLNILRELQREHRMGLLLVTHDMGVVAENATDVAVMHDGHLVELAPARDLFRTPLHPYSQGLLRAHPDLHDAQARHRRLPTVQRPVPELADLPSGWTRSPGSARLVRCAGALHPVLPVGAAVTRSAGGELP